MTVSRMKIVALCIVAWMGIGSASHAAAAERMCSADIDTLHRLCKTEVYSEDRLCRAEQKSYCVWKYSLCIRRCGAQDDAEAAHKLKERIKALEEELINSAGKSLNKRRQCKIDSDCRISYYRNGCSAISYSATRPTLARKIERRLPILQDYIARSGGAVIACKRAEIIPSCDANRQCVF